MQYTYNCNNCGVQISPGKDDTTCYGTCNSCQMEIITEINKEVETERDDFTNPVKEETQINDFNL